MVIHINYLSEKVEGLLERRAERKVVNERNKEVSKSILRLRNEYWNIMFSWRPRIVDGYLVWLSFLESKKEPFKFEDSRMYRTLAGRTKLSNRNLSKYIMESELDGTLIEVSEALELRLTRSLVSAYDRERAKCNMLSELKTIAGLDTSNIKFTLETRCESDTLIPVITCGNKVTQKLFSRLGILDKEAT